MKFTKISHNPVILKFFENYPNSHILKFFINHKLHRLVKLIILKLFYLLLFKVLYRLEFRDIQNLIINNKNYTGEPILILQNHSSSRDVLIILSSWAHFGVPTSVLGSTFSFSVKNRLSCIISHFFEMIPMYGSGEDIVNSITNRLIKGDCIGILPEGAQPSKNYKNLGLVQEIYTGPARIAYKYWKSTGKKLIIQPICSIGANNVFPPFNSEKKITKTKIILKCGKPFTLSFSELPDSNEIKEKTEHIAMRLATIWRQKELIPNYSFGDRHTFIEKKGKYRFYTSLEEE
jgi:1-acyl-sn-glycerol-3-phosphate acyltransferase